MACRCSSQPRLTRALHWRNQQVACNYLRDLGTCVRSPREGMLQSSDEGVPKRRADETAVQRHLERTGVDLCSGEQVHCGTSGLWGPRCGDTCDVGREDFLEEGEYACAGHMSRRACSDKKTSQLLRLWFARGAPRALRHTAVRVDFSWCSSVVFRQTAIARNRLQPAFYPSRAHRILRHDNKNLR